MPGESENPIPPQTLDPAELREARDRLMKDAPLADDELTKQHEIGDDGDRSNGPAPIAPPVRTD